MRNLIVIVVALVAVCCLAREANAQIQWNPQCALESAQQFSACKTGGGPTFGCLVRAGLHYWECSGSTFGTSAGGSRLRAAFTGARAVRAARRM